MKAHEELRRRMTERGWRQVELAKRIGADAPRVSRFLSGKLKPTFRVAIKIRDVLGIAPEVWL